MNTKLVYLFGFHILLKMKVGRLQITVSLPVTEAIIKQWEICSHLHLAYVKYVLINTEMGCTSCITDQFIKHIRKSITNLVKDIYYKCLIQNVELKLR